MPVSKDNFVDPIDSLTVERHVQFSKRLNARDIIRRFPVQWQRYKEKAITGYDEEGNYDIYIDDLLDFIEGLCDDEGWEYVFIGEKWNEELTGLEIW